MALLGTLEFPVGGDVEQLPMDRSPLQYAIAAATSFVAGAIAAWLPARKAASVDPVDILRGAT
jgi:lipoprotein-releasing system permease protein